MLRHNYKVTNYFTVIVQLRLVDNKLTQSDQISAKYLWKNSYKNNE